MGFKILFYLNTFELKYVLLILLIGKNVMEKALLCS